MFFEHSSLLYLIEMTAEVIYVLVTGYSARLIKWGDTVVVRVGDETRGAILRTLTRVQRQGKS